MAHGVRARVFVSGRSQHVTIPRQFRFNRPVVYVSRDAETGGLLIVERPSVEEVFAALDAAQLPVDFLGEADRNRRPPEVRHSLDDLGPEEKA